MSDISLYNESTELYDDLQYRRIDYIGAMDAFKDLGIKYLEGKDNLIISDFCCGTGKSSKMLSERLSIAKVTLIDINKDFLRIAKESGINTEIDIIEGDILDVQLKLESDVVISMFAYHHVKDRDKQKFINQIISTLKKDGILILGEIYTSDKETTIQYYKNLLNTIGYNSKSIELEKFLMQTANSDDFEFKVSQDFAHSQFNKSGFKLLESKKIWPVDNSFANDVGMFVEVWKLKS